MEEENNLKKEIEAILFAAGRMVELDEIARLCKEDKNKIEPLLKELKADYEKSDSPMFLIQEGNGWKMTVREKYLGVVKEVATHTELNKALLETLAIVAWKQPVMQADVVKIRGSTTYEHISALVEMGFITKIKHGRSFVLKPSTRFFDYFDLPSKEAVKEVFKDIELSDSDKRKRLGEKSGDQKKIDDVAGTGSNEDVEVY
ncbi:MAG: SMC-Scp complex subunit ScpB, partial [Candidatus Woesearchaeota archaeon]|nr:SMC-Scp complex subunit ScpB [Candidatus Woesearchaeota archaeon]